MGGNDAEKQALLREIAALKDQCLLERRRADQLTEELRLSREQNVIVQKQVEQEEEYITNKLMKRLEQLKKEKALLATEVEQEEEFLTNTLQKRLEKLAKEKVDLENRLEAEQEYIVNKLRKQLEQLAAEKNKLHKEKIDLENQLEAEQEYIMNKLQKQLEKLTSEKMNLQREKTELQRTVTDLGASVEKLNKDKVNLENSMEMEEENIVNRLQRQLEGLLHNIRLIEQKLEAKGITLKDLGISSTDLFSAADVHVYSRSPSQTSNSSIDRFSNPLMRSSYPAGPLQRDSIGSQRHSGQGPMRSSTELNATQQPSPPGPTTTASPPQVLTGNRRQRPLSASMEVCAK